MNIRWRRKRKRIFLSLDFFYDFFKNIIFFLFQKIKETTFIYSFKFFISLYF